MRLFHLAALVAGCALLAGAQPQARAQSLTQTARTMAGQPLFTDQDRREIEDWLRLGRHVLVDDESADKGRKHKKDKGVPPGLAKRDSLPPGLAKRDTLPPGLAKRELPGDLERRLSRLPSGYSRKSVGQDVVLIEEATGLVIDILKGMAR